MSDPQRLQHGNGLDGQSSQTGAVNINIEVPSENIASTLGGEIRGSPYRNTRPRHQLWTDDT
jgi:carbohydrate-selective porin OprB